MALNSLCHDPRQFHGHDLIGSMQHHEPQKDYDFAFATLAACSSNGHVRKRQIRRLLDIANAANDHNIGKICGAKLAKWVVWKIIALERRDVRSWIVSFYRGDVGA